MSFLVGISSELGRSSNWEYCYSKGGYGYMYAMCMLVMIFRQCTGYASNRAMIVRGWVTSHCFGLTCNEGCDESYGSYYGQDGT